MKEYTDADIALRIEGASEELASAQKVVITVERGSSQVTKDAEIVGDVATIHLTPADTETLGTGNASAELTLVTADGMVRKSNTVRFAIRDAVLEEVPNAQGNVD